MSYEGFEQHLCTNGHYFCTDPMYDPREYVSTDNAEEQAVKEAKKQFKALGL